MKTTPDMYPGSYARSALQRGLALEKTAGANPYAFGMIGSTDDHTSLATAEEDNFFGKFANSEPGVRTGTSRMAGLNADWELGASGLAAVWAPANPREDLFAGMKRRRFTPPPVRNVLRFFGGWNANPTAYTAPTLRPLAIAMACRWRPRRTDQRRTHLHGAGDEDPDAANLDQAQIIKGWIDGEGQTHEQIYYVALSDDWSVDPETGAPEPVGSTVDLKMSASATPSAVQLSAQWTDPDFNRPRGLYYARVIETRPRWSSMTASLIENSVKRHAPCRIAPTRHRSGTD